LWLLILVFPFLCKKSNKTEKENKENDKQYQKRRRSTHIIDFHIKKGVVEEAKMIMAGHMERKSH
jgi:hypothetical protein